MWNRKGTKRDESAQKAIRDHRDTIANETRGTARMPDDAMLEIKNICQREKMLYLTVDGRTNCELYRGETVRIVRSPLKTRLVRLRSYGFYDRLRAKMADYS